MKNDDYYSLSRIRFSKGVPGIYHHRLFIILKYSFGGFLLSPPYYVGAPIEIGGPLIGHGMLFVPIGSDAESKMQKLGSIIAFGLSLPS
jgi:hypothetical protein